MHFYVYILQSRVNDSFYKGSTNNLLRRFEEHNNGNVIATRRYLPWDLVWCTEKPDRAEAYRLEMKLKNLSVKKTVDFILKYPVCVMPPVFPPTTKTKYRLTKKEKSDNRKRHHQIKNGKAIAQSAIRFLGD